MAKWDDTRSDHQIKAYPRGKAQGGTAIQAVKGSMSENDGTAGHRTVTRETAEGRAIARTRDSMPMVEVSNTTCEIGVDSGRVDLHSIAPLSPYAFADGNLYRTEYVANYVAAPPTAYGPIIDVIEPPNDLSGKAPVDGAVAKSLRANEKPLNYPFVFAKKYTMMRCPPSIFTGRTRLWVQAIYGLHDTYTKLMLADTLPTIAPAVVINSYADAGPVTITTNCGVHLDPLTGKHWLIKVYTSKVRFYPLLNDEDCIDEMRALLVDPSVTVDEKERIETYILADCRPHIGKMQEVGAPSTTTYSMGYGWHFNWDGDRCDIVVNTMEEAPGGGYRNSSTHYRLRFSKTADDVWSATHEIVEGPVLWRNHKFTNVIAEPNWSEFGLERLGSTNGPAPFGNAPFYAFYKRNELKVCRYIAQTTGAEKSVLQRSPWYYNPTTYVTIGGDAITYETRESWTGTSYKLTCGEAIASYEASTYTGGKYTREGCQPVGLVERSHGDTVWYFTADFPVGEATSVATSPVDFGYGNTDVYTGLYDGPGVTHNVQTFGPYYNQQLTLGWAGSNVEEKSVSTHTENYGMLVGVVPFSDAEAFYMYASQSRFVTETGWTQTVYIEGYEWAGFRDKTTVAVWSKSTYPAFQQGHVAYYKEYPVNSQVNTTLVCNVDNLTGVNMNGINEFYDPIVDIVPRTYDTKTSAAGKAVFSEENGVDVGNGGGSTASTYVGWA